MLTLQELERQLKLVRGQCVQLAGPMVRQCLGSGRFEMVQAEQVVDHGTMPVVMPMGWLAAAQLEEYPIECWWWPTAIQGPAMKPKAMGQH